MAPLLLAGLSLLPKIPAIWASVAGLFGKKVPDSIEAAGKLAEELTAVVTSGNISPEAKVELEKIMASHEEEMAKIALEEKRLALEGTKLEYKDVQGVRDLEIAAYQTGDEYIARTRPKLLRDMWTAIRIFIFYVPLCVIAGHTIGLSASVLLAFIGVVEWIGGWLFGTFGAAYLGYSAARSVDKKNPNFKNGGGILNKVVKNLS